MLKMGKGSLGLSPNGTYFRVKAKRTELKEHPKSVIFLERIEEQLREMIDSGS